MADKEEKPQEKPQEQPKGGDHIPTDTQEEEQDEQPKGLLSAIGNPVGSVLNTALRPVGAPLEKAVTGPLGNALGGTTRPALGPLMGEKHERSELLGGDNKDSYEHKPESIAGKEQTGSNPLGLDKTGRWGFADDNK